MYIIAFSTAMWLVAPWPHLFPVFFLKMTSKQGSDRIFEGGEMPMKFEKIQRC